MHIKNQKNSSYGISREINQHTYTPTTVQMQHTPFDKKNSLTANKTTGLQIYFFKWK